MDRIVSAFAIMFALSSGAAASYLDTSNDTPCVLPSVAAVLPDPLPLDMSDPPVYTAHETTIVGKAPNPRPNVETRSTGNVAPANDARVWTCGSYRALSQGSGSVRECSYAMVQP